MSAPAIPAIWFPAVRTGTGTDVFTERLVAGLIARGIRAEITWLPLRAEYAPWSVAIPQPPAWATVCHINTWLHPRFIPARLPVVATLHHAIHDPADVFNPTVVTVVCDAAGRAQYFSRAPIPWARDAWGEGAHTLPEGLPVLRHVGLYAYRVGFLRRYAGLAPSPLEHWEALEQLRALWHGYRIRVLELADAPAAGVDTPQDLERVRALFTAGGV